MTAWDGAAWLPVTGVLDGAFPFVRALLPDAAGLTIGGGGFDGGRAADGSPVASRNVIRWDGAAWQPLGRGVDAEVRALARDGSGGLLVGGLLVGGLFSAATASDGTPVAARRLARWTGAAWQPVPDVTGVYPGGSAEALARVGTETVVGGILAAQSGRGTATVRAVGLTRLAADGTTRPLSAGTGRDGTFFTDGSGRYVRLAPDGCGGVHVVAPEEAGPRPETGRGVFRRWSGTAWQPVPDALRATVVRFASGAAPGTVIDVAGVPGRCDAFVIAGQFGSIDVDGAVTASANVARWSGTAWQPLGRGRQGTVRSAAVTADGVVTVGGLFDAVTQADGTAVPARSVARWSEAAGWTSLGGVGLNGATGVVSSVLPAADGSVVAAGSFNEVYDADGPPRPARSVARWTGTAWETFGGPLPVFNFPAEVRALVRWNGLLVVGGTFRQVEQPSGAVLDARTVAAWDGTAWRALPGLTTTVNTLAVLDGVLVASDGLDFGTARWTGTAWVPLGPDGPGSVYDVAAVGRRLYAGGAFETAGGVGSPGLAVFDLDAAVASDAPPATEPATLATFPNPARTSTTLAFRLDAPGRVRLTLLDALGRTVAVLADGDMAAGDQTLAVDVLRLPAGVYVARLADGARVQTRRITAVR